MKNSTTTKEILDPVKQQIYQDLILELEKLHITPRWNRLEFYSEWT